MNNRFFYAASNSYSTEYDIGIANMWFVMAFDSRKARDEYVNNAEDKATRAIVKSEISRYTGTPKPFSGFHLAIVNQRYWNDDLPNGYLGTITFANNTDAGEMFSPTRDPGYVRRLWN